MNKTAACLLVFVGWLSCPNVHAQGLRAVTRRTLMTPAPAMGLMPGNPSANSLPQAAPQPAPAPVIRTYRYRVEYAVRPPEDSAKKLLDFQMKKAREGSAYAQLELGKRYAHGDGVEKDPALAREWIEKAARNGSKEAERELKLLPKAPDATPKQTSKETAPPQPPDHIARP